MRFETVKDHIAQHAQKTSKNGQDVAASLRTGKVLDIAAQTPKQEMSAKEDDDEKKLEQDGLDILCQAETTRFLERKETSGQNMSKAHALIHRQCSMELKNTRSSRRRCGTI